MCFAVCVSLCLSCHVCVCDTVCTHDVEVHCASFSSRVSSIALYVSVRWGVELSDDINDFNTKFGRLSDLLVWHFKHRTDERERQRNADGCVVQHNRNVFVDHPEWAQRLWPQEVQALVDAGRLTAADVNGATVVAVDPNGDVAMD